MTEKEKKIWNRLLIICAVTVAVLIVGAATGYMIYDRWNVTEYEAQKLAEKEAEEAARRQEMEEDLQNRDKNEKFVYNNDKICLNCTDIQWLPALVYNPNGYSGIWDGYEELCPGCGYTYGFEEGSYEEIWQEHVNEMQESVASE